MLFRDENDRFFLRQLLSSRKKLIFFTASVFVTTNVQQNVVYAVSSRKMFKKMWFMLFRDEENSKFFSLPHFVGKTE
jgi:hypothetical protein